MSRSDNYSEDEVIALVENYEELVFRKDRPWLFVRLVDLETALEKLPEVEREAVILCGLLGCSTRLAAELTGRPPTTTWRHYKRGLVRLTRIINGQRP